LAQRATLAPAAHWLPSLPLTHWLPSSAPPPLVSKPTSIRAFFAFYQIANALRKRKSGSIRWTQCYWLDCVRAHLSLINGPFAPGGCLM
jgi:hypothetical protein